MTATIDNVMLKFKELMVLGRSCLI